MKSHKRSAAFTLLELVVVLSILAIVTGIAVRALDRVEDQRRFEAAQRGLEELSDAVLGSPDDRAADGVRTIGGFVADMGRLPRTVGATELTLGELWKDPGIPFDVRAAVADNGVPPADEDPQVLVPGGWRGPYLQLPIGAATLRDGWGNPVTSPFAVSPANPDTTGYARLRALDGSAITTSGQEIRVVRHLGANGRQDADDTGYDRDETLAFNDGQFRASLIGHVEVLDGNSPATADPSDIIKIRLFSPDPANPAQIVVASVSVPFSTNPVTWQIPAGSGATIGPRVVRAYFNDVGTSTTSFRKSAVKHVTLRPGANFLELTIDR